MRKQVAQIGMLALCILSLLVAQPTALGEEGLVTGQRTENSDIVHGCYIPLAFSEYNISPSRPALLAPTNGSTVQTLIPHLYWNSGIRPVGAFGIYVGVALEPQMGGWVEGSGSSGGFDDYWVEENLQSDTTYYWQVTWLPDDLYCNSDIWSFTTSSETQALLPAPFLTAPTSGAIMPYEDVPLSWTAVDGAVGYRVRYREVGTSYWYRQPWGSTSATQETIRSLEPNVSYEWRVEAHDEYAWGQSSETRIFTTVAID